MTATDKSLRILEAAKDLFLQNGLRGTSMEAIARKAGVAKPTLYARFPDKEAVFVALGTAIMGDYRRAFAEALAGPGSAAERLIAAIGAKYDSIDRLLGQSPHGPELMAEHMRLNRTVFDDLRAWVNEQTAAVLQAEGVPDAAERARVILAAVDGLKVEFPSTADVARLTRFVVDRLAR
ncbi:TetR/AcrR family transcriptional regulator [Allitabrizicola rongguiensis]|uniref:TetR/AcrR family transcriptional regulator n=1 Tax=Alitabrizicola rongguiensis TaxID=2909234 RepID=UPI0029E80CD9|nr:helix-turn-helix domain-containing protein [Tabrizicola rongguiensis]